MKKKRLGQGKELARVSFQVLRADKKLMAFPVLSLLMLLSLVGAGAATQLLLVPRWMPAYDAWAAHLPSQLHWLASALPFVAGFAALYCLYFVTVFFNTAMVKCILSSLNGQPISLGAGLAFAMGRLPAIAGYAALATTVGLLIRIAGQRKWIGWLLSLVMSTAWDVATILAVPVLVQEKRGGLASVKRSAQLFKSVWGDGLMAHIRLWGWMLLALTASVGGVLLSFFTGSFAVGVMAVALFVVAAPVLFLIATTLETILASALYVYAAEGVVPGGFNDPAMDDIWRVRNA